MAYDLRKTFKPQRQAATLRPQQKPMPKSAPAMVGDDGLEPPTLSV